MSTRIEHLEGSPYEVAYGGTASVIVLAASLDEAIDVAAAWAREHRIGDRQNISAVRRIGITALRRVEG